MTRPIPGRPLHRAGGFTAPIVAIAAAALVMAGIALTVDRSDLVALVSTLAVLAIGATVVFRARANRRSAQVDLFLVSVTSVLGWPDPDRTKVAARTWKGGWIGTPRRIRLVYNTVAALEANLLELVNELRRRASARFGVQFRVAKHNERRGVVMLAAHDTELGRESEEKTERVRTHMAKIFGSDAHVATKTDDAGDPKEITVQFEVSPRLTRGGVQNSIERATSAVLKGRWRAFWDLQRDFVRFELRPQLESLIRNPFVAPASVDPKATYDGLEIPVGVDEDGEVICWSIKNQAHGLVTGETGKGKTVVILGITEYLAGLGWRIWGVDGKRIELLGLREYPNVELIAGRIDHQARAVHAVFDIMQDRMEKYERRELRLEDMDPMLLVVDEFKTFRNALIAWYRTVKPKGAASVPPTLTEFSDMVSLARKLRIHILIGLQRPDSEFLTGDMRDNFGFRLSLGRLSPEGAKMMWQSYAIGTTVPVRAKGRGIAYNKAGKAVEVQTYWTPDPEQTDPREPERWTFPDDLELVENARPKVNLWETKRIIDPDDSPEFDDNGKLIKAGPDFDDYMASRIAKASLADQEPTRVMAGVFTSPKAQQLEQIQIAAEEPDEELQPFEGFRDTETLALEDLLDEEGSPRIEGVLVEVEDGVWGVLDGADIDAKDDAYIELTYRNYETGELGMVSLAAEERLNIRSPEGA